MINFNLPGLYEHSRLNLFFLNLMHTHKEWFNDDIKIESVFGNFPYCIWDGGRNFIYYEQTTKEEIAHIQKQYLMFGVNPRFIFTNPDIIEEDLDDRFCNNILKMFENTGSEVVINSDLMKNYIKKTYPSFKLISSTTKCITNPQEALEEIANSDYYQVCLDYNLNKNMDFLNSIPKEDRHKVEILCNVICPPHCPYRKQHYIKTGRSHLTYLKQHYTVVPWCGIDQGINHPTKLGQGNNLSFEDIKKYHEMGFNYFKLEGRTLDTGTVFGNYLYYLIKPEYHYLAIETIATQNILFNNYNDRDVFEYVGQKPANEVTY